MDSRHTPLRRLAPIVLAFVLAAGAAGTAVAVQPPEPDRIAFGQVGIAFGQSVEVTVVNVGRNAPPEPEAPAMELLILDQGGNILARSIEKVAPGQSVTLKFNGDTMRRAFSLNRMHLRALVRFNAPPEPDAPAPRIVASFEVVDNFTGRTSFAFVNPPEPESQLRAP